MNSFEPALPPIPVSTAGAKEPSPEARSLGRIRRDSCYRRARIAISAALLLEAAGGMGWLLFTLITRRGPAPLALTAMLVFGMLVSVICAEVATAVLDLADGAVQDRLKHLSARHDAA